MACKTDDLFCVVRFFGEKSNLFQNTAFIDLEVHLFQDLLHALAQAFFIGFGGEILPGEQEGELFPEESQTLLQVDFQVMTLTLAHFDERDKRPLHRCFHQRCHLFLSRSLFSDREKRFRQREQVRYMLLPLLHTFSSADIG